MAQGDDDAQQDDAQQDDAQQDDAQRDDASATGSSEPAPGPRLPFVASFDDHRRGRLVGTAVATGVDVEGVIGADHGAVRIAPLTRPGWGRSCVTWGPWANDCGLTLSVVVLNGHNASENTDPWPTAARFLTQWVRGTQVDAVLARLWAYRRYGGRERLRRRLDARRANARTVAAGGGQHENLAVGLLGSPAPTDHAGGGAAFVMRSAGPANGTLLAGHQLQAVLDGVQNVPLQYVVVLRPQGALYAVGSLPGVGATAPMPEVRPVLIDPTPLPDRLWAGVHQAVLGQVGWAVDTRVDAVRVARPAQLTNWYTTATLAERHPLEGDGPAHPAGARWREATWSDTDIAVLDAPTPTGLLHAVAELHHHEHRVGVLLRVDAEARGGWMVSVHAGRVEAVAFDGGRPVVTHAAEAAVTPGRPLSLQVLDDGDHLTVLIDGNTALGPLPAGPPGATGIGVCRPARDRQGTLTDFEAHPARITLPGELAVDPPPLPTGDTLVLTDDFRGAAGDLTERSAAGPPGDLNERSAAGPTEWVHTIGRTPFRLDGRGAAVTPVTPPRRTPLSRAALLLRAGEHRNAYTLDWPDPSSADLAVTLEAPGNGQGEGARGRGGLLFEQDRRHLLIVNTWLDDEYGGTSVSSFLRIGGFEDVYDAVWTNVGRRITWGRPYRLRVAFDGLVYVAFVEDEPVLYRRITDIVPAAARLRIERVGIVSNWEFGDDTGSRFLGFEASRRGGDPTPASGRR